MNGLPPAGSQKSLETARLSLRPCSPPHILALIEQPQHFERVAGLPAADGLHEMFSSGEVSPDWLAALRACRESDPWRHGFFLVHHGIRAVIGSAHTLPSANASTRVLVKCGFRHVGVVVDPEDGPVWRWERGR